MKDFLLYIGDVYSKMCAAMGKNGILTGVLIAIIIVVIYSILIHPVNINKIVEKAFEKEKTEMLEETEKAIERRLQADEIIAPIAEEILQQYHLGRFLCFEKHNSIQSISGIDFLYFSATIETLNADELDLDYIADDFQRQSVSNQFGALISNLRYKDFLYIPNIGNCHHASHTVIRRFNKLGANSLLFVPLRDKKHRPVVILCFTSKHPEMDYVGILEALKPHMSLIKQLLIG